MGKTSFVLHILLLSCCIIFTYQASLDSHRVKRSHNTEQGHREGQRALVEIREDEEVTEDREERASNDCGFSCPEGEKMVQNDTNIPRANGCGPNGMKLLFVDEAAENCCMAHDFCYEICGKPRLDCDVMLRDCIKDLRRKRDTSSSRVKRGWHSMMASAFYRTVRTFGCKAYKRGQTRGCMCVHDDEYAAINPFPAHDTADTGENKEGGFKFNVFSGFT